MKKTFSVITLALLGTLSGVAQANIVDNSTVTINSGSPAYPNYEQPFAIDTGASRYSTDFAGNNTGTTTFLGFDFGSAQTFTQILYTDRTSSGGGNGSNMMGTGDFVTQYEYIFSNNADFSSPIATVVTNAIAPVAPTSYTDFQSTTNINNVTARYVEWQVLATTGANPGAADFQFTTAVPEPESYGMMMAGLGLLGFMVRRRKDNQV